VRTTAQQSEAQAPAAKPSGSNDSFVIGVDYGSPAGRAVVAAVLNAGIDPARVIGIGTAIHAAVAAGAYPDVESASRAMGKVNKNQYTPNEANAAAFDKLYAEYTLLHDYFGRGANDVMKRLRELKRNGASAGSAATDATASVAPSTSGAGADDAAAAEVSTS
jgi:ribulose kinase